MFNFNQTQYCGTYFFIALVNLKIQHLFAIFIWIFKLSERIAILRYCSTYFILR